MFTKFQLISVRKLNHFTANLKRKWKRKIIFYDENLFLPIVKLFAFTTPPNFSSCNDFTLMGKFGCLKNIRVMLQSVICTHKLIINI